MNSQISQYLLPAVSKAIAEIISKEGFEPPIDQAPGGPLVVLTLAQKKYLFLTKLQKILAANVLGNSYSIQDLFKNEADFEPDQEVRNAILPILKQKLVDTLSELHSEDEEELGVKPEIEGASSLDAFMIAFNKIGLKQQEVALYERLKALQTQPLVTSNPNRYLQGFFTKTTPNSTSLIEALNEWFKQNQSSIFFQEKVNQTITALLVKRVLQILTQSELNFTQQALDQLKADLEACDSYEKYSEAIYKFVNTAGLPEDDRELLEEALVNHLYEVQKLSNLQLNDDPANAAKKRMVALHRAYFLNEQEVPEIRKYDEINKTILQKLNLLEQRVEQKTGIFRSIRNWFTGSNKYANADLIRRLKQQFTNNPPSSFIEYSRTISTVSKNILVVNDDKLKVGLKEIKELLFDAAHSRKAPLPDINQRSLLFRQYISIEMQEQNTALTNAVNSKKKRTFLGLFSSANPKLDTMLADVKAAREGLYTASASVDEKAYRAQCVKYLAILHKHIGILKASDAERRGISLDTTYSGIVTLLKSDFFAFIENYILKADKITNRSNFQLNFEMELLDFIYPMCKLIDPVHATTKQVDALRTIDVKLLSAGIEQEEIDARVGAYESLHQKVIARNVPESQRNIVNNLIDTKMGTISNLSAEESAALERSLKLQTFYTTLKTSVMKFMNDAINFKQTGQVSLTQFEQDLIVLQPILNGVGSIPTVGTAAQTGLNFAATIFTAVAKKNQREKLANTAANVDPAQIETLCEAIARNMTHILEIQINLVMTDHVPNFATAVSMMMLDAARTCPELFADKSLSIQEAFCYAPFVANQKAPNSILSSGNVGPLGIVKKTILLEPNPKLNVATSAESLIRETGIVIDKRISAATTQREYHVKKAQPNNPNDKARAKYSFIHGTSKLLDKMKLAGSQHVGLLDGENNPIPDSAKKYTDLVVWHDLPAPQFTTAQKKPTNVQSVEVGVGAEQVEIDAASVATAAQKTTERANQNELLVSEAQRAAKAAEALASAKQEEADALRRENDAEEQRLNEEERKIQLAERRRKLQKVEGAPSLTTESSSLQGNSSTFKFSAASTASSAPAQPTVVSSYGSLNNDPEKEGKKKTTGLFGY